MKDARDIRLPGIIGFITCMVLCCFVAFAEHPTFVGSIAAERKPSALSTNGPGKAEIIWYDVTNGVTYRFVIPTKDSNAWLRTNPAPLARPESSTWRVIEPHAPMLLPEIQDQKHRWVGEIDLNLLNWNQGFIPNPNEGRMRIEPALKIKNQFPGGVRQYDLIDLNYKPDFKLPD